MQRGRSALVVLLFLSMAISCGDGSSAPEDTLSSGKINISVDETFKPIVEQQLMVFDSSFPDADIRIQYKSESACIQDFLKDRSRLILVTRELSDIENKLLQTKKVVPTSLPLAKDGVAVILHNSSVDTILSISELKGILAGVFIRKYSVVFDNQGSSTLRYMRDSLMGSRPFGANVFAAKNNDSVIQYVSRNPNAIGFVSVSYVADYDDPEGLGFLSSVRIAEVTNDKLGESFKPYQVNIAPNKYPLTRVLYYIHRETYPGLGTGFANFLARERGQLIFKQARLFPLRMNIIFREAGINN